jgi:ribulose-5-phosphate 4-epimerase/fuculose-1-phosphate aldolase
MSVTPQTDLARALADISHRFYARGWVLGTSGNFSIVEARDPLRLAITASGRDKRTLSASDIVIVDDAGQNPSGWNPNYTHSGTDRDFQPVCFGPAYFGASIQAPPIGPA